MKRKRSLTYDRGLLHIARREVFEAPHASLMKADLHLRRVADTLEGLAVLVGRRAQGPPRALPEREAQHGRFYKLLELQLLEAAGHIRETFTVLEHAAFAVFEMKRDKEDLLGRPDGEDRKAEPSILGCALLILCDQEVDDVCEAPA